MLQIYCSGSPYEVGLQHGTAARSLILGSIAFYKEYFWENSKLSWPEAVDKALEFLPLLERDWVDFVEEIKGIAAGVGGDVGLGDILALNVRSEIAMGLMTDGCTALSWTAGSDSILAQNWDWDIRQKANLVALHISPTNGPDIAQIAEAGVLGKIGINSHGIGVCLNAIRQKGVDFTRLPIHLGLRALLNSSSKDETIKRLSKVGIASACHILVADKNGGVGLEWSHKGNAILEPRDGVIVHSNHFVSLQKDEANGPSISKDSPSRLLRMDELVQEARKGAKLPSVTEVERMLDDEMGFPVSINRKAAADSKLETLFSIVMDLGIGEASVRVGRPNEEGERFLLKVDVS